MNNQTDERRLTTDEYLNRIRNVDVFGPGWWWFLQNEALDAQSKEDIEYFLRKLPAG